RWVAGGRNKFGGTTQRSSHSRLAPDARSTQREEIHMSISTDAPTDGTAIAFVDCEISAGTGPSPGGGVQAHAHRRWEVVIAGKRIKTVDVHAHCIVPDAAKLINHPLEAPALLWSNVGDRLAQMDKSGVDVEALSINPFWYRAERDTV